jgi:hypothetical protein
LLGALSEPAPALPLMPASFSAFSLAQVLSALSQQQQQLLLLLLRDDCILLRALQG